MLFNLFLLITTVTSGTIDTLEFNLDFLNVGFTRTLTFDIKLSSGLGNGGYFSLKLPFSLETTLTSQVPQGVSATYNEVSTIDCSSISILQAKIFKDALGWYHIQFLDLDGSPTGLSTNTYYQITITTQQAFTNQEAKILDPIPAITIQDYTETKWYYYDTNDKFAQLEFIAAPPSTLVVAASLLSTTPKLLDFRHNVLVSITPTIFIERKSRIMIKMSDTDYKFSGQQCTSESYNYTNATNTSQIITVDALNSSQYQCLILNNILTVDLYQTFNTTLKFSFTIRNPKFVKSVGGGFEFLTLNSYANNIIETGVVNGLLSTDQLSWGISNANLITYFAWGLKLSDSTLPAPIGIYRSNTDNPFYNSFKFTFYPSLDTPINLRLKVIINFYAEANTRVLQGSLAHNLPQFDKNPVKCALSGYDYVCENVGTLTSDSNYYFNAKILFPYSATPTALGSSFGTITVYSYHDGGYDATPLITGGRDVNANYNTKKYVTITSQSDNNGFTLVHSQDYSVPKVPVSKLNYGLKYSNTIEQMIIFSTNTPANTYTTNTNYPIGIDVYTSTIIKKGKSQQKGFATSGTFSIVPGTTSDTAKIEENTQYTRIRVGADDITNLNSIFATTVASLKEIGIGPVYINGNGTQYCSDQQIDIFGQTASYLYSTVSSSNIFVSNAYTLSYGSQMPNLFISMVNFWTSTGTAYLDGSAFPAFIRITGYLDQLNVQNVSKLAVFFNNLNPFDSSIRDDGTTSAYCSSSLNDYQECIRFKGDDSSTQSIYHLNRIEFLLDNTIGKSGPASPFQLLIPVQTIANINNIYLNIGTIYESDFGITVFKDIKSSLTYQTGLSKTATFALAQNSAITTMNYKLDVTTAPIPTVGATEELAKIYYGHTDSGTNVNANTATQKGAGFFYQSTYDMVGNTFDITTGTIVNQAQTYSTKCQRYHYNQFYGFFCPMNTGPITLTAYLSISGYNYPTNGITLPSNTYSGWSTNSGNLVSYSVDTPGGQLTPGTISSTTSTVIKKGQSDQAISWVFKTSNVIPQNSYIEVSFNTGTSWSFSVDNSAKCYLQSSSKASQVSHTCTITQVSGLSIKFALSGTSNFGVDTYTLLQYGITQPDTSTSPLAYTIGTYSSSGTVIDRSPIGGLSLTFDNSPSTPGILITDFKYQAYNDTIGEISLIFQFQNRGVLYNQYIQMNIGVLSFSTPGSYTYSIKNLQSTFVYDWKSIDLSNVNSITMNPVQDILQNTKYQIYFYNVGKPSTPSSPTIKVLDKGANLLFQSSNSATLVMLDPITTTVTTTIAEPTLSSPSSLLVRDFSISNTDIRSTSTYTYYLQNIDAIAIGEYLYIELSYQDYGILPQLKPPSACSGYLESDPTQIYLSKCESLNNLLTLQFEAQVAANTQFIVTIQDMTNQEATSCPIRKPVISIVSNDKSNYKAIATKLRANINKFKFSTNPNIRYTYWKLESNRIDMSYELSSSDTFIRLNYNTLTLIPGQYSNFITLGQIDQPFNKILKYTLSSSSGTFQSPNDLIVYPGDGKLITRIGCLSNTNIGTYYLYFTQSESDPIIYSNVGIIQAVVVNKTISIKSEYDSYNIQLLYYSIPILFDFSDYISVEDLIVELEIVPQKADDSPGFVFQINNDAKTSFTINKESYKQSFIVQSVNDITNITSNHTAEIKLTFSGVSYYTQTTTTKLILVNETKLDTLEMIMVLKELSDYSYKQIISVTVNADAILYFHCVLLDGIERNYSQVKEMISQNYLMKNSDYDLEQVGIYYLKANQSKSFEIGQLKARTWYKIQSWVLDIYDRQNQSSYKEFVTQNNKGRLMKLEFNYGTIPNNDYKKQLVCWLCQSLSYPCLNLMTYDAIYCDTDTSTNIGFNSTQTYTPYRMMQGTTDTSSTTGTTTTNDTSTSSSLELVDNQLQVYFMPNKKLLIDESWKLVQEGTQDSQFLNYFVGNLTNNTILYSVNSLYEVVPSESPELISTVSFTRGTTWLYMKNIRLRDTGLIWGYIVPKFINGTYANDSFIPTSKQIKYRANNLNQTVDSNYFFIIYFERGQQSISYNLTNLNSSRWYNIYFIVTIDNPNLWAKCSSVYNYTNKTLRVSFDKPVAVNQWQLVIGIAFLILIN